jgi:DNA-binding NarL/FixJ family response regulator
MDAYSETKMIIYYTNNLSSTSLSAVNNIHSLSPSLSLVVLSESNKNREIYPIIEAGAQSYISMTSTAEDLLDGLKKVLNGEKYISVGLDDPETINEDMLPGDLSSNDKNFELSNRQHDVLNKILLGQTNKEIARSLEIGEGTVKSYCSIIYRKLDVENRSQAILRAKEF